VARMGAKKTVVKFLSIKKTNYLHVKHVRYIHMIFPPTCFGGGVPSF
jgi:hypothetical protein